jgi:hypothetical protein
MEEGKHRETRDRGELALGLEMSTFPSPPSPTTPKLKKRENSITASPTLATVVYPHSAAYDSGVRLEISISGADIYPVEERVDH